MLQALLGVVVGVIITLVLLKRTRTKDILVNDNRDNNLEYEVRSLSGKIGGLETELFLRQEELGNTKVELDIVKNQLNDEIERNKTVLSQKKSSEVRTGQIAESLSPFFMDDINPKRLRFLGNPIDYISFEDDGIIFIEIKSGASKLSFNQKQIKKLVHDKKVFWKEVRIDGKKQGLK